MFSRLPRKGPAAVLAWISLSHSPAFAVTFEIADAAEFNRIIDTSAVHTTHATINTWLEGPTWVPSGGGYLVFCDQGNNRLKKLVPPATVTDFLLPPASTLFNGTLLDGQERLICAEAGSAGRKISRVVNGVTTPLVTTCNGLKFYSPNDVAVKSDGTIWFTDPNYNSGTTQGSSGYPAGYYVYRFDSANGNATCTAVITSGPLRPNGICFSPDETRLYVADSDNGANGHRLYAYTVSAGNTLSGGTVFANINNGVPDGIKCDSDGRVWSSAGNGVHIYAPDGHLIGRIIFNRTANVCFGGPQYKTLYMVGQPLVTSMRVLVSGPQVLKKLQIKNQGGQLMLFWPAPSTGWTLQETEHLETPGAWTNSPLSIVTTNDQNKVVVGTTGAAKFFRLRLN
ncbi:MAG: SMP-30/gluconolactonase/LRE family protein [Verrucomicrobiota bacterium]